MPMMMYNNSCLRKVSEYKLNKVLTHKKKKKHFFFGGGGGGGEVGFCWVSLGSQVKTRCLY